MRDRFSPFIFVGLALAAILLSVCGKKENSPNPAASAIPDQIPNTWSGEADWTDNAFQLIELSP